jgi:O-6-methylguanine DNA methyltransferase
MEKRNETFTDRVRRIVQAIPKGKTMTYKAVAQKAGNPQAARAVARIMAANFDPKIPCHRVIRSDGGLGGYNRGGTEAKRKILVAEGAFTLRAKN